MPVRTSRVGTLCGLSHPRIATEEVWSLSIARKKIGWAAAMIAALLTVAPGAMALEGAVDATWAQRYVWRGIPVNEEAVIQPSITLSGEQFSLNVWANMDLTDWGEGAGYGDESGDFTEVDYTGSFQAGLGPAELGAGFITYTFPNHSEWGPALSTTEAWLSLGFDVPLSPSLAWYLDVDDQPSEGAGYMSLDLGHSFELGEFAALELSGHLGWANHKFLKFYYQINEESDLHDWSAGVSLLVSLPGGLYLAPGYYYTSLLEDESRDVVEDEWDLDTEAGIFMVSVDWNGGN